MIVTRKRQTRWDEERIARYKRALTAPGATRTSLAEEFGHRSILSLVTSHNRLVRAGITLPSLPRALPEERESTPGVQGRPQIEPIARGPERLAPPRAGPPVPPSRLPEANAYHTAAWWLQEWGHTVTWQTFGEAEVPVIDDRLSNVAYLCALWLDERTRRFGSASRARLSEKPHGHNGRSIQNGVNHG